MNSTTYDVINSYASAILPTLVYLYMLIPIGVVIILVLQEFTFKIKVKRILAENLKNVVILAKDASNDEALHTWLLEHGAIYMRLPYDSVKLSDDTSINDNRYMFRVPMLYVSDINNDIPISIITFDYKIEG